MALTLAEKEALRRNDRWRSRIHIAVIEHALGIVQAIANDATALTAGQTLALKYRLQADNPDFQIFRAAAAWIAARIDDEAFLTSAITYSAIETWLTNGDATYDTQIRAIVSGFFPKLAHLNALEDAAANA